MTRLRSILALAAVAAALSPAYATQGFSFGGGGKADATLYSRAEGDTVRVAIEIDIDHGWHLYHDDLGNPDAIGKPTTVDLSGDGITWCKVAFPEPLKLEQPGLGTWIYGHEGKIVLYAVGRASGSAGQVGATIDGLTCEDSGSCVLYNQSVKSGGSGADALFASFPASLVADCSTDGDGGKGGGGSDGPDGSGGATDPGVVGSSGGGGPGATGYGAVAFDDFQPRSEAVSRSLLTWLLLAFLAGMILNVMPCVLPVISIKVLSFVQQSGEDRKRIFTLGLAFAAGILVVFIALAVLAVTAGLSWGEQFQSQEFLVVMIGIVFAFALSMFGVFELGVPSGVGAAAGGMREGHGDAFFKGMLATVLATPCSGPFLGSTLTWTLSQPPTTVFAIFVALGLGMALPYVVLTANPALLKMVPKPGAWMETFKQAMGFVLMATVIYLMVSLRQDLLLFTCAFLVFVGFACWWWGRFSSYGQSKAKQLATLVVSLALAAGGAWFSFGLLQETFAEASGDSAWVRFEPDTFEEYLADGRSVFVDFTAEWCPNCKLNEKWVYEDDEVVQRFQEKGVVRFKADMTQASPYTDMLERLMLGLGARSIPFMALFPGDSVTEPHVRFDIVGKTDMLDLLGSLPNPSSTAAVSSALRD